MENNSPRSSSRLSIAASAYSAAGSTRHILGGHNNVSSGDYDPPSSPPGINDSRDTLSHYRGPTGTTATGVSLMVNYLPSKFSASLVSRKGDKGIEPHLPKNGGGVEAFRSGESRMSGRRLRWTKFKWILFCTNFCLSLYSLVSLVICLLTWFDVWAHADVVRVGNRPELIISTIAASIGIFTSLMGWAGILMNNRGFLAMYTFLTWITFAFLVTPGYMTYRHRTFNLEGKINAEWSRKLGASGRLRIQDQLECCGYFSPFIEATVSSTCYARALLPGCKLPYLTFQRLVLGRWYKAAFSLVPLHIVVMIAGLLCSNHVTYRFGKGMMPEAYRLNASSMAVIMENYASQLAEQYGSEVADEVYKLSRSNLSLVGDMPSTPINTARRPAQAPYHAKYESLGGGH